MHFLYLVRSVVRIESVRLCIDDHAHFNQLWCLLRPLAFYVTGVSAHALIEQKDRMQMTTKWRKIDLNCCRPAANSTVLISLLSDRPTEAEHNDINSVAFNTRSAGQWFNDENIISMALTSAYASRSSPLHWSVVRSRWADAQPLFTWARGLSRWRRRRQ